MKKLVMVVTMALASALMAQDKTISLADARGKIGDVVAKPEAMTEVMQQLSAADQKAYIADVNDAISKMPGSANEKTAKFVSVNEAALKGAKKGKDGNLTDLVAEVFATVSPEALPVVSKRFATDLFNRAADPSKTYTDDQYKEISQNVMSKVQARTATADDANARNAAAIQMMVDASNGTPADLKDTLLAGIKDDAERGGVTEAIDEAAGEPYIQVALAQAPAALLADLGSAAGVFAGSMTSSVATMLPQDDPGLARIPRTMATDMKFNPGYRRGESVRESFGYDGQNEGSNHRWND